MNETLRARTRVVVTGLGAITPAGQTVAEFWDNLVNGRSGIDYMHLIDPVDFACKVAGEVKAWEPKKFIEHKAARRMARFSQFMVAAAGASTSTKRTATALASSSATAAAATPTSRKAPKRSSTAAG